MGVLGGEGGGLIPEFEGEGGLLVGPEAHETPVGDGHFLNEDGSSGAGKCPGRSGGVRESGPWTRCRGRRCGPGCRDGVRSGWSSAYPRARRAHGTWRRWPERRRSVFRCALRIDCCIEVVWREPRERGAGVWNQWVAGGWRVVIGWCTINSAPWPRTVHRAPNRCTGGRRGCRKSSVRPLAET